MENSKIFLIAFCLICFLLGFYRYLVLESRANNYELKEYLDSEKEIILIGRIIKEPDVRENNVKLTIGVRAFKEAQTKGDLIFCDSCCRLLATVSSYPEYKYGDELKIKGKIEAPFIFEDFNYKNYLKKDGIYSVIYYPEIELLSGREKDGKKTSVFFVFYSSLLEFKDKLRQVIYKNIPWPQGSVLGAVILGDKNRMSYELKEKLNIAGVRHITAVSGLHIVLVSGILMSLLIAFGFWRQQAIYISLIFLFLFIGLTGFQTSSVRAGIMAGLFLLGQAFGRMSFSLRTIIIAAGLMLVYNPLLLFYGVGFQLSFLAAFGIISLGSFFRKHLIFLPEKKLLNLKNIIAMTLSAYIFTLPVLIYNFGRISLVSLLTNVLILPVVCWIIIFGFSFSLAGVFLPLLGRLLFFPVWLLLTYVLKIVEFFSAPWAARTIKDIHWFWIIIFYLILFSVVWQIKKREKLRFLNY